MRNTFPPQVGNISGILVILEKYRKVPSKITVPDRRRIGHVDMSVLVVLDSKSRNIPEVVIVRHGAVGVLGIWRGWDSWVKGGANGVSLQAT